MGIVLNQQWKNSQLNFATLAPMVFSLCLKSWGSGNVILVMVKLWCLVWSIHGYKTKEFSWIFFSNLGGGACNPFSAKWCHEHLYLASWNLASSPHLTATSRCNLIWTTTSCPRLTTNGNSLMHYTKFTRSEAGSSLFENGHKEEANTSSPCRWPEVGQWRQWRVCVPQLVGVICHKIMCCSNCFWK
jgi:hypothetical protein